jgi:hypothetical protein
MLLRATSRRRRVVSLTLLLQRLLLLVLLRRWRELLRRKRADGTARIHPPSLHRKGGCDGVGRIGSLRRCRKVHHFLSVCCVESSLVVVVAAENDTAAAHRDHGRRGLRISMSA